MKSFGKEIKKIRKNRSYTQEEVAEGIISRDTITRIERYDQHTSFQTGIALLERMGVSLTDFDNLLMNDDEDDFSELTNLFLYQYRSPADVETLEKIYKLGFDIYKNKNIKMAKYLMIVSDVLLWMDENLLDTRKLKEMKIKIEPVWNDLSKVDEWSMLDLKILNSIFFIFDLDVAEKIMTRACGILNSKYPSLRGLQASFLTNYTYLLICYGKYTEALECNKDARMKSAENGRYDLVIISDLRQVYLEQNLGWEVHLEEQLKLLSILGSERLAESFRKEADSVINVLNNSNK